MTRSDFFQTKEPREGGGRGSSSLGRSPLIFADGRAVLHRRVMWDGIRAFLVQVGEDEVSHLGVQLPDTGGHHGDGEGSFVVRRHLLLSLFLQEKKN